MIHSGIDIVYIPRLTRIATRYQERFYNKIFTVKEQAYVCKPALHAARLAGAWAAKEAVVKALGTGWLGISYQEVEILGQAGKAPTLQLYGAAQPIGGTWQWSLSISHDGDYATAIAVALEPSQK